mmetsp:Transcript_6106/g.16511  ORF Transcript_6106/g.16511 Transcript_6106/m.16511 type:complete len:214 (+) Transcript_6106:753-1394(+)
MLTKGAASTSPVSCSFVNFLTCGSGETWKATLLSMHSALITKAKLKVMANHDLGASFSFVPPSVCWVPLCAAATLTREGAGGTVALRWPPAPSRRSPRASAARSATLLFVLVARGCPAGGATTGLRREWGKVVLFPASGIADAFAEAPAERFNDSPPVRSVSSTRGSTLRCQSTRTAPQSPPRPRMPWPWLGILRPLSGRQSAPLNQTRRPAR